MRSINSFIFSLLLAASTAAHATLAQPMAAGRDYLAPSGDASQTKVTPSGATQASTLAMLSVRFISVDDWTPARDGVTDDTSKFVAAFANCAANGGGTVLYGPYQYLLDSADLVIPPGCFLRGGNLNLGQRTAQNYNTAPYTLVLNPAYTIKVSARAGLERVLIRRKGMTPPANVRDVINTVNAFSGTAVTCAGNDCDMVDSMIVGFSTGFYSTGWGRPVLRNVYIDATSCVNIDNAHDVARFDNVHCFPFATVNLGYNVTTYAVSNAVDNGSGSYRLTLPTHALVTGDVVNVYQLGGAQSTQNRWTVTVINSTTVDLQGSALSTTTTGTWASGAASMSVASVNNIAIGQTVTGTNIPGGTTVTYIYPEKKLVFLSASTTGAGSGASVTFADTAYTTGGSLTVNGNRRTGPAFTLSNSETAASNSCFTFGHDTGFLISGTTIASNIVNLGTDYNPLYDPNVIGVSLQGTGWGNKFSNLDVATAWTAVQQLSTGAPGNLISNLNSNHGTGGRAIDVQAGRLVVSNAVGITAGNITVSSATTRFTLSSGDLSTVALWYENATAVAKTSLVNTNILKVNSLIGGITQAFPAATYTLNSGLTIDGGIQAGHYFGQPTLTAPAPMTLTGPVATIYCAGPPIAGTNVTISSNPRCGFFNGSIQVAGSVSLQSGGAWNGGSISINDSSGGNVTSIGTGTTTGAVNIGNANNFTNNVGPRQINGKLVESPTLPTIASGFGSSPVPPSGIGTRAFTMTVGTGGTANTGVLQMPGGATSGWACSVTNVSNPGTSNPKAYKLSASQITVTNYSQTLGTVTAFTAGDQLDFQCSGY